MLTDQQMIAIIDSSHILDPIVKNYFFGFQLVLFIIALSSFAICVNSYVNTKGFSYISLVLAAAFGGAFFFLNYKTDSWELPVSNVKMEQIITHISKYGSLSNNQKNGLYLSYRLCVEDSKKCTNQELLSYIKSNFSTTN